MSLREQVDGFVQQLHKETWITTDGYSRVSVTTRQVVCCWLTVGANVSCRRLIDASQVLTCDPRVCVLAWRQLHSFFDWILIYLLFLLDNRFLNRRKFTRATGELNCIHIKIERMASMFRCLLAIFAIIVCCWTTSTASPTVRNEGKPTKPNKQNTDLHFFLPFQIL